MPLAHTYKDKTGTWREHALENHLKDVAKLAGNFAGKFNASDWAEIAGLWHDLGKYSDEFQNYIKNVTGYQVDAHIENQPGRVDHSTAGAIHAVEKFGECGIVLAYLIAGHHAGLADWHSLNITGTSTLPVRLEKKEQLCKALKANPPTEILNREAPTSKPKRGTDLSFSLWVRMLFSCLVDADFLDTEIFMDEDKEKSSQRGSYSSIKDLKIKFDVFMEEKQAKAELSFVNTLRSNIFKQCIEKASSKTNLLSLAVPTGGGKTLASMAFALAHAIEHEKKRIIYVIPYTSIIEQTADVFRQIFGESVVEHHSNLDPDKETLKSRLATENWDAPIIITTNVQFFESLFATRTSRVRKLHNIVNSVVILDEAQLFPPIFLQAILNVVKDLASIYGVTFLFSTATQPTLSQHAYPDLPFDGLPHIQEIIGNPDELSQKLNQRVKIQLPKNYHEFQTWEAIATELMNYQSVLCIVNRRDDSRELYKLMPEGTYYLSALMCGEHRSKVIKEIKEKLLNKIPVRVISTQLVEAGVDFDFPVVYRAMAGLDSIAQAAGRCNREGKLDCGKVVVFIPPKPAPKGLLRKSEDAAKSFLHTRSDDEILSHSNFATYFKQFYASVNSFDEKKIIDDLSWSNNQSKPQFKTADLKFQLVDESCYKAVIVLYDNSFENTEILKSKGPERWLMRKLQRFVVNIPKQLHADLLKKGDIKEFYPGIFVQQFSALYDDKIGFIGGSLQYNITDYFY